MNIETKYEFGDEVYSILHGRKEVKSACGFCSGTGYILGANEESRMCPLCYGRGSAIEWEDEAWNVRDGFLTIGQVRVESTKSKGREGEEVFDNFKPQSKYKEDYMCEETGIGTGSLWNVDKLFPTKEAAQAECDKRNKETA